MAQPTPALVEQPALDDGSSQTAIVAAAAAATTAVTSCTPSGSPPTRPGSYPASDVLSPVTAVVTTMNDNACGGDSGDCAASDQDFAKLHVGSAATENVSSCSGSTSGRSSRCSSRSRGASDEEKIVEGFDPAPFAAAEKEKDLEGSSLGSEVSGSYAGIGLTTGAEMRTGLGARRPSRRSIFRQSSGDLLSLAAAAEERQDRGGLPQDLRRRRGKKSGGVACGS